MCPQFTSVLFSSLENIHVSRAMNKRYVESTLVHKMPAVQALSILK